MRIKEIIHAMSSGVRVIIALILILLTSTLMFSDGLALFIAAIGGVIVLLGLMIEYEAEEEDKKEHLSNLTEDAARPKHKGKVGYKILMIGIVVEILVAGYEAVHSEIEMRKIRAQAVKNDPLNQPITDVFVRLIIDVEGNRDTVPQDKDAWESSAELLEKDINSRTLDLGKFAVMSGGGIRMFRYLGRLPSNLPMEPHHGFTMDFHVNPMLPFDAKGSHIQVATPITPRDLIERIEAVRFTLPFIPKDAEIIEGRVELVMNGGGTSGKLFKVFRQKTDKDMASYYPDYAGFFLVATNSP